ncbi:hypothetical protein FFI89_009115 [Bradyrhizobium sp. KBS0727]|uniref:hypothetical protein n=1 Tax=unclassified Bradyrhizobium TaxID=2631580 RepID=UPI00110EDAEA|nr:MULTISPECIES: hypothetical protein [unclassified Bradyrhizobium]QDW37286.1 hypothetical protein FFI71_009115 [Bradyrhizobium sp. KBS0725]QDW43889.1 hypothetical protein FFI89_009115 [Bradyrhizobium sp. KBS0727]
MDSIFWKGSTHNRRNSRQSSWEVRRENAGGGNRCSYSDIFFIVLAPQPKQLPQFAVTAVIANDKARHQMRLPIQRRTISLERFHTAWSEH